MTSEWKARYESATMAANQSRAYYQGLVRRLEARNKKLEDRVVELEARFEGEGLDRYFVDVGDGCFEFFRTSEEARKCAADAISEYADQCDPEWSPDVENVMWGVVQERAVEVRLDAEAPEGCDYAATFELRRLPDERKEGE